MIKLTKNELRSVQGRLQLLNKYLPTLQLKKALLQAEVSQAKEELLELAKEVAQVKQDITHFSALFTESVYFDLSSAVTIQEVKKRYENIAGVEVPYFEEVIFHPFEYLLVDTPPWLDSALEQLKKLATLQERIAVAEEKKSALEKEQREVSIRVNLFEKVLIPRAISTIKKIQVFLGDQQLAAVARAKVAKGKIA